MELQCSFKYQGKLYPGQIAEVSIADKTLKLVHMKALLQETITWCKPRILAEEPASCLRSPELKPPNWIEDWSGEDPKFSNPKLVKPLAHIRATRIRRTSLVKCLLGSLEGGRLLVTLLDWRLFEGAVQVECANYIGAWDVPPWDTWVWFGTDKQNGDYLLSWVPTEFVGLIDEALWAMSMPWLYWVDTTSPPIG